MKKLPKILIAVVIVLALGFIGSIVVVQSTANDTITKDDGVAAGYYEKINYSLPLERKYAQLGPYDFTERIVPSGDEAIGDYRIYFPTQPAGEQQKEAFPLVVMVNGTMTPASTYAPILEHLASWGFVVVGNEDPQSGSGESTSRTLEFILGQNNAPTSQLFNTINTGAIGIAGHSQGGAGAINAATKFPNSHNYGSLYTASAISHWTAKRNNGDYDTGLLEIPAFLMAGTGGQDAIFISSHRQLTKNYQAITSNQPTIKARRTGVDHKDVLEYGDPYMTAWFLWTLKADPTAEAVFVGTNAELINNPNWQDIAWKNLP